MVEELPPCSAPSTLAVANITASSADLSWVETGTATVWEIEYGPAGFTQGTGTVVPGVTNPYTLGGLSASTSYDWYVRADCGLGDFSNWTGPNNFVTDCDAFVAPFFEDFENGAPVPPICWTNTSNNTDLWKFTTTNLGHSAPADHTTGTGYFAAVDDSQNTPLTITTLTTPFIDVSGLTTPQLDFWLWSDDEGNWIKYDPSYKCLGRFSME